MNCGKCYKDITNKSVSLECIICNKVVHLTTQCSGLTSRQILIRVTQNLEWMCRECLLATPRRRSFEPDDEDELKSQTGVYMDAKQLLSDSNISQSGLYIDKQLCFFSKNAENSNKYEMKRYTQSLQSQTNRMAEISQFGGDTKMHDTSSKMEHFIKPGIKDFTQAPQSLQSEMNKMAEINQLGVDTKMSNISNKMEYFITPAIKDFTRVTQSPQSEINKMAEINQLGVDTTMSNNKIEYCIAPAMKDFRQNLQSQTYKMEQVSQSGVSINKTFHYISKEENTTNQDIKVVTQALQSQNNKEEIKSQSGESIDTKPNYMLKDIENSTNREINVVTQGFQSQTVKMEETNQSSVAMNIKLHNISKTVENSTKHEIKGVSQVQSRIMVDETGIHTRLNNTSKDVGNPTEREIKVVTQSGLPQHEKLKEISQSGVSIDNKLPNVTNKVENSKTREIKVVRQVLQPQNDKLEDSNKRETKIVTQAHQPQNEKIHEIRQYGIDSKLNNTSKEVRDSIKREIKVITQAPHLQNNMEEISQSGVPIDNKLPDMTTKVENSTEREIKVVMSQNNMVEEISQPGVFFYNKLPNVIKKVENPTERKIKVVAQNLTPQNNNVEEISQCSVSIDNKQSNIPKEVEDSTKREINFVTKALRAQNNEVEEISQSGVSIDNKLSNITKKAENSIERKIKVAIQTSQPQNDKVEEISESDVSVDIKLPNVTKKVENSTKREIKVVTIPLQVQNNKVEELSQSVDIKLPLHVTKKVEGSSKREINVVTQARHPQKEKAEEITQFGVSVDIKLPNSTKEVENSTKHKIKVASQVQSQNNKVDEICKPGTETKENTISKDVENSTERKIKVVTQTLQPQNNKVEEIRQSGDSVVNIKLPNITKKVENSTEREIKVVTQFLHSKNDKVEEINQSDVSVDIKLPHITKKVENSAKRKIQVVSRVQSQSDKMDEIYQPHIDTKLNTTSNDVENSTERKIKVATQALQPQNEKLIEISEPGVDTKLRNISKETENVTKREMKDITQTIQSRTVKMEETSQSGVSINIKLPHIKNEVETANKRETKANQSQHVKVEETNQPGICTQMSDISKAVEVLFKREIEEFTQVLQSQRDKMDEIYKNVEAYKQMIADLKQVNLEITNRNNYLETRMNALEQRLQEAEKTNLKKFTDISNPPVCGDENSHKIMNGVEALEVNRPEADIKESVRVPETTENNHSMECRVDLKSKKKVDIKRSVRMLETKELQEIIEENTISENIESLNASVDEKKKVHIEENELGSNILAERRNKLETAAQGWRKRVPQSDASLFTVAGRLERDKVTTTPPLTPPPLSTPPASSPAVTPAVPTPNRFRSRKAPNSPTNGFASGPLRSASCAVMTAAVETKPKEAPRPDRESFKRSHSVSESISRVDEKEESSLGGEKIGCQVRVPRADDETFQAFFTPALEQQEKTAAADVDVDLDAIDSGSRQMLAGDWARRAKRERRHVSSRNPLRALAARTDLRDEYRAQPLTMRDQLFKEKVTANCGLAAEALAALASKEDFSNVALRSASATSIPSQGTKALMLLQVKGRRRVQTRLVEPVHTNVNRGDCFLLVTPDQVFLYIGLYANVIERNRSTDIAQHIHNTKDLGCKNSTAIIKIDEQTKNYSNKHWNQFWSLLGVTEGIEDYEPIATGGADEDEIFESCIIQTNMCYEVIDDELVPIQEYWGQMPKISMLNQSKVIVFDFGSEMYIWYGKNVPLESRRRAAQLAQELFDEGYNYEDCHINPIFSASHQGNRDGSDMSVKSAKNRPEWAILSKITQHMETILFKEKFLDWPDYSRVIKVKPQENKSNSLEINPCDAEEMWSNEYQDPDLILEGSHIGRGTHYYDKESMRHYDIKTKSVAKWVIREYDYQKVENESEIGEFFSGDSYIIRWEYQITVSGRELNGKPSKHNVTGRDRCAYFCWQGKDASSNEKGAAALLTVELDREKGPQVRVAQGNEPPAFLNLFRGKLVIHQGKKDVDKSRYRLFVTRGNVPNEAYLLQVPCSVRQLRSRGSLLLVDTAKANMYIWHGARSLKHTKQIAIELANKLVARQSSYLFGNSVNDVKITEVKEGEESKEVLEGLGVTNKQYYNSVLSAGRESGGDITPRLFHFTDLGGQFEANEVLSPLRQENLVTPFPFEQKELYSASQPALFMVDDGKNVWLWQGWWPRGEDGELEPAERSAGVGAFAARWQAMRAAALRTADAYWRLSRASEHLNKPGLEQGQAEPEPNSQVRPEVRVIAAGLEPETFTDLFDTWAEHDEAAEANIAHGWKAGEQQCGARELARLSGRGEQLPLAALQRRPLPDHVDPHHLERHLSSPDFQEAFGMTKEEFSVLPAWKQTNMKKDIGLF